MTDPKAANDVSAPVSPAHHEATRYSARPSDGASEETLPLLKTSSVQVVLGEGSTSVVERVLDPDLHRPVALKRLRPELTQDPDEVAAFLREARIAASIQHNHVPPVFRIGRTKDGGPALLMQEIEGSTLRQWLSQSFSQSQESLGKGLEPGNLLRARLNRVAEALIPVCSALQRAHGLGWVHCDVKPENIVLSRHGGVYLTDWGLAENVGGEAPSPVGLTGTWLQNRSIANPFPLLPTCTHSAIVFEAATEHSSTRASTRAPDWSSVGRSCTNRVSRRHA